VSRREFVGKRIMKNSTTNQHERHEPELRNLTLKPSILPGKLPKFWFLLKISSKQFVMVGVVRGKNSS
jgi:hypothetical protein